MIIIMGSVLFIGSVLLGGCSAPTPETPAEPVEPGLAFEVSLYDVPTRLLGDELFKVYAQGEVAIAIDDKGETAAVLRRPADRVFAGFELTVYDSGGAQLWSSNFGGHRWMSGRIEVFAEGQLIAATLNRGEQGGHMYLFDSAGRELWSRAVSTGATVNASPAGDTISVFDHEDEAVSIRSTTGDVLFWSAVTGHALVQFVADGEQILVVDETQLTLFDREGNPSWRYPLNRDLTRNLLMTDAGEYIAVATGHGDNMLYLFNQSGKALWKYPLELGGSNRLRFFDGDEYLAVYDTGTSAGVHLFDVSEGKLEWFVKFRPGEGHRINADALRFGQEIVLELVDTFRNLDDEEVTVQYLVGLDYNGQPLWKINLGSGAIVSLNGDASRMLLAEPLGHGEKEHEWNIRLHDIETLSNE